MGKKVTDSTDFAVGDLIKLDGKDGISIFVVNRINKSDRLGIQLACVDHTSKQFLWHQTQLIDQNAEIISIVELMFLFQSTQKKLREVEERAEEEAIDSARREDNSGGKFS